MNLDLECIFFTGVCYELQHESCFYKTFLHPKSIFTEGILAFAIYAYLCGRAHMWGIYDVYWACYLERCRLNKIRDL
jgi:hypothetical protein